jgi:exopolysaccharide production protein ExoF
MNLKMGMYSGLMTEALERAPDAARSTNGDNRPEIGFSIVRTAADGKASVVAADENTPVLPGDVIKVEVKPATVNSN